MTSCLDNTLERNECECRVVCAYIGNPLMKSTYITYANNSIYTNKEIKQAILQQQKDKWRGKHLHGQFPKAVLDQANIDKEGSFKWIKKQQITPSVESSVFAIQDQAVMTRQHQRDILKLEVDGKCRLCASKDENDEVAKSQRARIMSRDTTVWFSMCIDVWHKNRTLRWRIFGEKKPLWNRR